VRAPERQRAMTEERRRWAEEDGPSPGLIEDFFKRLVSYFVNREMEDWKGDG
jgi:chorismate mutase